MRDMASVTGHNRGNLSGVQIKGGGAKGGAAQEMIFMDRGTIHNLWMMMGAVGICAADCVRERSESSAGARDGRGKKRWRLRSSLGATRGQLFYAIFGGRV